MSRVLESICFFLNSGRTFTFREVVVTCDNETVLGFRYKAMSDSEYKEATFQKSQFVGFSVCRRVPPAVQTGGLAPPVGWEPDPLPVGPGPRVGRIRVARPTRRSRKKKRR